MKAEVEFIRIYGANPAIPPAEDPEVGVSVIDGSTRIGDQDTNSPSGSAAVPIPASGENRSIMVTTAVRVVQPADPVTTISNVRFFVKQSAIDALGGKWEGIHVWTPASTEDAAGFDAFVASGGGVGSKDADYVQATRTLEAQGWIGDSIEDLHDVDDVEDVLEFPNQGRLDLTGKGRSGGTTATFGRSVNDVSRMFIVQAGLTADASSEPKPTLVFTCRFDEAL